MSAIGCFLASFYTILVLKYFWQGRTFTMSYFAEMHEQALVPRIIVNIFAGISVFVMFLLIPPVVFIEGILDHQLWRAVCSNPFAATEELRDPQE